MPRAVRSCASSASATRGAKPVATIVEDGHRVAGLVQIGSDLAADQAAADDGPARCAALRAQFRTPPAQRQQVVEAVEDQEIRPPRDQRRRDARGGAGGEDEHFVIQQLAVLQDQPLLVPVDQPCLATGVHAHSGRQRIEALEDDLRRRRVAQRQAM